MELNRIQEMNFGNKIIKFINRDIRDNNESMKRTLIIRLLSVLMCVYFIVLGLIFANVSQYPLVIICTICFFAHVAGLILTYMNKSFAAYIFMNAIAIAWLTLFIFILGWDCGVQHLIFILLVLVCFVIYDKVFLKVSYMAALCVLRIGMYFYCRAHKPYILESDHTLVALQIINTLIIFISVGIVSIIASNYSHEAEKKLVMYNRRLEKVASTDMLTDLPNRRGMISHMTSLLDENPEKKFFTVAIGDVDFFKKVNDQYGHECGDVVLKELAKVLNDSIKGKGWVSRWGGEEFLFIFEDLNKDESVHLLMRVRESLAKLVIFYKEHPIKIEMTFGVAEHTTFDFQETIRKADEKLFIGKESGRNQIIS